MIPVCGILLLPYVLFIVVAAISGHNSYYICMRVTTTNVRTLCGRRTITANLRHHVNKLCNGNGAHVIDDNDNDNDSVNIPTDMYRYTLICAT